MPTWVRRPDHPEADEFGMIPKEWDTEPKTWTVSVISDTMPMVKHHGTGRMIDSKAKFRSDTRTSGCIEIGNEVVKPRQPVPLDRAARRDAIRQSMYQLRNGR